MSETPEAVLVRFIELHLRPGAQNRENTERWGEAKNALEALASLHQRQEELERKLSQYERGLNLTDEEMDAVSLRTQLQQAEQERDEARKRNQYDVDAIVHYRNLAIMCGAKPENMLNEWDRNLCERGITPDEHEYDPYNAIEDLAEEWDKVTLQRQLQQAETALRRVRAEHACCWHGWGSSADRALHDPDGACKPAALAAPPPNPKEELDLGWHRDGIHSHPASECPPNPKEGIEMDATHREAIGAVQPSAGVGDAQPQDEEGG